MKTSHPTQEVVACPVCRYPFTSSWHLAGCEMSSAQQVVEACPPEWTRPECWDDQSERTADLFPLASIAHELKTPMVVMLGYTDLLRSCQLGSVNANQSQVLSEMQQSGERLQRLIKNMLRLCELRHGKTGFHTATETSEVNQQLRMTFDHWKPMAQRKSIRYEFVTASCDCWIPMNAIDLHLVVSNLIDNAIKFTPERGTVLVTIRSCFWEDRETQGRLPFETQAKGNRKIENAVQIDVRDTGPGVSLENRQRIFGDFVRLSGAPPGNGLGLAIARRLVMAHGGRIWVENAPAIGNTFTVLLPTIADSNREHP